MVIPSLSSPTEENNAKTHNLFAYVSVQNENAQDKKPKPRHAQIRKCNITNYHKVSNLILKEVKMFYASFLGFSATSPLLLSDADCNFYENMV